MNILEVGCRTFEGDFVFVMVWKSWDFLVFLGYFRLNPLFCLGFV